MIKAIIFDCFGVVISDALSVMSEELQKNDSEASQKISSWLEQSNRGQLSAEESSRHIAAIFGLPYEDYRQKLSDSEIKDLALLNYIRDLRPKYKTALLSNIPKGSLARRFSGEELTRYFDVVVASGEVGYAKPEAEIYEITADRLGVRFDECVFTDDRAPYCEGAQGVGMRTILYQSFEQFRSDLEALLAADS